MAGSEGGSRRLGGGGGQRRAGEHGQAEQQQRRGKAAAGPLPRHPHATSGAAPAEPQPLSVSQKRLAVRGRRREPVRRFSSSRICASFWYICGSSGGQHRASRGSRRRGLRSTLSRTSHTLPQPHRIPHLLPLGFRVVSVPEQVAQSVGYGHLRGVENKTHVLPTEPRDRPAAHHARGSPSEHRQNPPRFRGTAGGCTPPPGRCPPGCTRQGSAAAAAPPPPPGAMGKRGRRWAPGSVGSHRSDAALTRCQRRPAPRRSGRHPGRRAGHRRRGGAEPGAQARRAARSAAPHSWQRRRHPAAHKETPSRSPAHHSDS